MNYYYFSPPFGGWETLVYYFLELMSRLMLIMEWNVYANVLSGMTYILKMTNMVE